MSRTKCFSYIHHTHWTPRRDAWKYRAIYILAAIPVTGGFLYSCNSTDTREVKFLKIFLKLRYEFYFIRLKKKIQPFEILKRSLNTQCFDIYRAIGGRQMMQSNFNCELFYPEWTTSNNQQIILRRSVNGQMRYYQIRGEILMLALNLIIMRETIRFTKSNKWFKKFDFFLIFFA